MGCDDGALTAWVLEVMRAELAERQSKDWLAARDRTGHPVPTAPADLLWAA
jgi:hypothetical protein